MKALLAQSDLEHTQQAKPQANGNGNLSNEAIGMPRPLSEDALLKDSLGVLMQCLADDREARRGDRELNRALIAKLTNGSGEKNKLQGWMPTIMAVSMMLFAGVAWFPKQETKVGSLEGELSTLKRDLEQARQDITIKRTYDERMRSNLRDLGISIDPETAEITVVVPRKVKR